MASKELKFYKLINKIETKYSTKQLTTIKQFLNFDNIKFQLNNPLHLHPFPTVNPDQIPYIILFLARQMEEVALKNVSLINLEHFVANNFDSLLKVLNEKIFHCQLFCLAFIRCLQQYARSKEMGQQIANLKVFPFLGLFSAILQKRKINKINKPTKIQQKQINHQIHTVFLALLLTSSIKYVKQPDQQELQEENYLSKALEVACLLVDETQDELEREVLREYLSVSQHLLIFNGLTMRPIKLLEFCLDNNQGLEFGRLHTQEVKYSLIEKYLKALSSYCKTDPSYHIILLKTVKSMLTLNINNSMLISHFQILFDLIRYNLYPLLKKTLLDILISLLSKRNMPIVDQIFLCIIGSGIDLLDDEMQKYCLILAQNGDNKRKEQFTVIYYHHYEQSFNRVHPQIINFIMDVYLEQNLPLEKIELMVSKEALVIYTHIVKKLIAAISQKSLNIHITLLSIILEKRRDDSFKQCNKAANYLFICEDWLNSARNNTEIYRIYLKIIAEILCGKSLEIHPALINLGSCIVKIHDQYYVRSLEFYSIILKTAEINDIFEENLFRYMILLQAIFGDKLPATSYSYFSKNFSKIIHPQSTFLTYLEYLVTLLKNKASVLLYLQSVLEFQMHLNETFFEKKLYDISFLANLIEESDFFRLSTYCLESVTVLYQLSLLVTNNNFQEDYQKIMKSWSHIMSRSQCKHLSYFFAFREIKKIYPFMKERQMKIPSDRIKMIWDLILILLDHQGKQQEYINMSPNSLVLVWKGDESSKKELKIEGRFIRNTNMELYWKIRIETTLKSYIISINNDRLVVQSQQIKQQNNEINCYRAVLKEQTMRELKKRPQVVQYQIKVQNQSKKLQLNFSILDNSLPPMFLDGNIKELTISCKSNAILKDIRIVDATNNRQLNEIQAHIQTINQWQVKIASLQKYQMQNFCSKFDFDHAYCCLGEMLRHFSYINLPFAFEIFIRLSIRLIKYNKGQSSLLLQMMVQVFNTIESTYSTLRGRNKTLKPIIEISQPKMYPKQLYFLFTSALLPLSFWKNFLLQTQQELIKLLKQLLQTPQFREFESNKLELFDKSLQISRQQTNFFQICIIIIDRHQLNDILSMKFKKIISLARESSIFQKHFSSLLEKILQYLNIQNEQFVTQRSRCKYLIIDSQCIREIFLFCNMKLKIDLLHYLSQNPSFNSKKQPNSLYLIKQLISVIDSQERYELMPWLIVEVKLILMKKPKEKNIEDSKSYRIRYLYLELLLLNRNAGNGEQNEDIIDFILKLLNTLIIDLKQESCKSQLEGFFYSTVYLNFLIDITREINEKYGNVRNSNNKDKIVQIYELSLDIITKFEKKSFLQFIIKYRFLCSRDAPLLRSLIQQEKFKNLKLSHFSIFLQYLFEILILIEYNSIASQEGEQIIACITEYIQFMFHSLDEKTKLSKSLFYNFPHLAGHKEGMQDNQRILRSLRNLVGSSSLLQLRGGIYFKCVLIIIKLLKLTPNQDYSNLVDYFLFGPKKHIKQERGLISLITDLHTAKQRSSVELYITDVNEDHKLYFNKQDLPENNKNEYVDLSAYITDYFLMSIAEFLHKFSFKLDLQLLQKYSNSFIRGCANQKILKQFQIAAIDNYQVKSYEDIIKLIEKYNERSGDSPLMAGNSSPSKSSKRLEISQKSIKNTELPQYQQSLKDIQSSPPPLRRARTRKTQDFSSQSKRRSQLLESIKQNPKGWYKLQSSKYISTYFCQRAKEIRIIELIQTHFVLKIQSFKSIIITPSKLKEGYDVFIKKYNNSLAQQKKQISNQGQIDIQAKTRKVKKLFPYTASKLPVLNIVQNCFENMTCPMTLKIIKTDYSIRRLQSQQSTNMNFYLESRQQEDQSNLIPHELDRYEIQQCDKISNSYSEIIQAQESDSPMLKQGSFCELVTREGVYFCQYQIQSSKLILQSKMERPTNDKLWYLKLGTPEENLLHFQLRFQIDPQDVVEIFYRKFNQITNNSLEIFLKNGTSKFISFYRKETLASLIKHLQKLFKGVKIIKDAVKEFEELRYTEKWAEGYLSNFDYLMLLNKFSGRTYNDLNQYYVFPWIIQDYHSSKIDLTNPDVYRDLSKPIGALNPQKLRRYKEKYRNEVLNNERVGQRCIYGSHYSTSLFIFYYLVRLQPFSSLHRQMQKGNWDVADRLFNSIDQVWESLMSQSSPTDIKECIPEFYYMPTFLRNIANIELGKKQCGSDVGDVQLPNWAQNAQQFVITLRAALQSNYVSENLHLWIDLIFGKFQNSQEKHNIFHPYSYSDPEVLLKVNGKNHKNIDGIICQISYFGQCPLQLFKKQHRAKKLFVQTRSSKSINKGHSQSTSSQNVYGEVSLPTGWKISKITNDHNDFTLEIQHKSKQDKLMIVLSAFATHEALKSSAENILPIKKNEIKAANEPKIMVNTKHEIFIDKEFQMDLDVKFNFQHCELNEIWIACFGSKGIRIYNWQYQLNWSWENEQVKQVHLQTTRLIFSNPNGKLFFYSFLDRKLQEIVVFKQVYDMNIKVICLPRLPAVSKNQINYKVLCIGDGIRLSIISFTFQQTCNFTSQGRSSIN